VKYWEIIADNLSKAGWSWGCVAAIDSSGRTIFVADAHRDEGKRFFVRADEKTTADGRARPAGKIKPDRSSLDHPAISPSPCVFAAPKRIGLKSHYAAVGNARKLLIHRNQKSIP
jgi:hypothetical protein